MFGQVHLEMPEISEYEPGVQSRTAVTISLPQRILDCVTCQERLTLPRLHISEFERFQCHRCLTDNEQWYEDTMPANNGFDHWVSRFKLNLAFGASTLPVAFLLPLLLWKDERLWWLYPLTIVPISLLAVIAPPLLIFRDWQLLRLSEAEKNQRRIQNSKKMLRRLIIFVTVMTLFLPSVFSISFTTLTWVVDNYQTKTDTRDANLGGQPAEGSGELVTPGVNEAVTDGLVTTLIYFLVLFSIFGFLSIASALAAIWSLWVFVRRLNLRLPRLLPNDRKLWAKVVVADAGITFNLPQNEMERIQWHGFKILNDGNLELTGIRKEHVRTLSQGNISFPEPNGAEPKLIYKVVADNQGQILSSNMQQFMPRYY